MSAMKWEDAEIMINRKDEIGILLRNIYLASVKLKKAAKERNDFFSAAAHELKTPVTILKGQLTGMIYHVGAYADREKYLRKAYDATEEMEQRVLHILDIAGMENSSYKVCRDHINFSKILRDKIGIYEDGMNDKQIKLEIDFPDEIYITGDKKLLEKAVENILQNAVKYSPEGEADNLFVPFYRLEESRSKDKGERDWFLYCKKSIKNAKIQITYRLSSGKLQIRKLYYESEMGSSGSFLFCMMMKKR